MLKNFSIISNIKASLPVNNYFNGFLMNPKLIKKFSIHRFNLTHKKNFCENNEINKIHSNNASENVNSTNKKKFSIKNMKKQLKEYGYLGLFVYVVIYIPTIVSIYLLFKTKTLDPAKVVDILSSFGADRFTDLNKLRELSHTEGATIAFTLMCNSLTLMVRLPLTLYFTILIKKMMRK